ncbi:hypothetical protein A2625_06535 [candidate division WOR-1 bacterium RIFCSPHIGHO2_01_FULL_53_15]|uniref:HEPN domain-containing protein n=1 Tax=candidate division WOR-1 bacterium RIFCSPHIGHO2_01_FULL_53_15 TaxID=1802564 RepID=A0A1F4Q1J6_UNCSA|nr:MAG: hypothetical protein A2625_06535 [candidate division WOR-1 bacterium RIFCSPHIGHO2_01_FULL_53_15]OGC12804.1 MAG: hypothetical protein A3D23_03615 [candidate division WOR-1 bacterium RIFCSPHIGHO2_02_FULL_53_26]
MIEEIGREIEKIMKKAGRALVSAKNLLNDGDYDFASSKAYYAAFHAMQAALLTKSLSFSKHSGVIAAFNQHFIKTGVFPKDFSAKIESLFKERQIGDYSYEEEITNKDAEEDIKNSEKIVQAIRSFLN